MSNVNDKPIAIIGTGGHSSVLADILIKQKRNIVALITPDVKPERQVFNNIPVYNDDEFAKTFTPNDVALVNGIGLIPGNNIRNKIYERYFQNGYKFVSVISSDAYISPFSSIDEGVQIFSGAIIQPGVIIGPHTVINTKAVIEHDCNIGAYNFIAPAATLCGSVTTSEHVFIGASATIIQGIELGAHTIVAAGAVVTAKIESGKICYPARSITR